MSRIAGSPGTAPHPEVVSLLSHVLAWTALLVPLCATVLTTDVLQTFSPDSWSYYELARTWKDDTGFYTFSTYRSYEDPDVRFSTSFPPAWPSVVAFADVTTGLGPRSGVAAAAVAVLVLAGLLTRLFASWSVPSQAAPLVVAGLLACWPFYDELVAARSMPLTLALLAGLLLALTAAPSSLPATGTAGILLGVLVLTRFEWLPAVLLLPLLLTALRRLTAWRAATLTAAALAVTGPWAAMSSSATGRALASDNSRVALSARSIYVQDYLATPPRTVFDDPLGWLQRLADNASTLVDSAAAASSTGPVICIAAIALLTSRRDGASPRMRMRMRSGSGAVPLLLAFGVVTTTHVLTATLVLGYVDARYWMSAGLVVLLAWAVRRRIELAGPRLLLLVSVVVGVCAGVRPAVTLLPPDVGRGPAHANRALSEPVAVMALDAVRACSAAGERLLVLPGQDYVLPFRLGATTGITTLAPPTNLDALDVHELRRFVVDFRPTAVLVSDASFAPDVARLQRIAAATGGQSLPTRCRDNWFVLPSSLDAPD